MSSSLLLIANSTCALFYRETEKDVLSKNDYELREGINITSSNPPKHSRTSAGAKIPNHSRLVEEVLANTPVHTLDCGHPNPARDIDDCGNNLCWAIVAVEFIYSNLKIKGGNYKLIELNCERLLDCYKEEKTAYPYIIKKAF